MPKASSIIDDFAAIAAAMREQDSPAGEAVASPDAELIRLCDQLDPDAELLELCAAFHEQHAVAVNADDDDENAQCAALEERTDIVDEIMSIHATTLAGTREKAGVALVLMAENGHDESTSDEIRTAMATLHDLAGPSLRG